MKVNGMESFRRVFAKNINDQKIQDSIRDAIDECERRNNSESTSVLIHNPNNGKNGLNQKISKIHSSIMFCTEHWKGNPRRFKKLFRNISLFVDINRGSASAMQSYAPVLSISYNLRKVDPKEAEQHQRGFLKALESNAIADNPRHCDL